MRTAEAIIKASAEEVWRYLTVPELMTAWMPGVENIRTQDGGVLVQGAVLEFETRGKTRTSVVDKLTPQTSLVLTSTQGSLVATYRYELQPAAGAIRLSLGIECSAMGAMRLLAPLVGRLIWMSDKSQPDRLKQALEVAG